MISVAIINFNITVRVVPLVKLFVLATKVISLDAVLIGRKIFPNRTLTWRFTKPTGKRSYRRGKWQWFEVAAGTTAHCSRWRWNGCNGLFVFFLCKPVIVVKTYRIRIDVGKSINPPGQPNRIRFNVSSRLRIVISEVVVKRIARHEFAVKIGVLPMDINQLQRRDEVNSPSQLNFCLLAHYRMRDAPTAFIVTMDGLRVNIHALSSHSSRP